MYAQVVEQYGWVLGVDVKAARPDVLERPADGAARERWVDYVLTQEPDLARSDLDDLGRNDLIARVTKPEKTVAKKATSDAAKSKATASADKTDGTSESGD
jgi:hypothetical protein